MKKYQFTPTEFPDKIECPEQCYTAIQNKFIIYPNLIILISGIFDNNLRDGGNRGTDYRFSIPADFLG